MSETPMSDQPEFDAYAADYEAALQEGLSATGEDSAFFAERRVTWLKKRLDAMGVAPRRILDFGCGTGGSTPYLLSIPGVEKIVGGDVSAASLAVARQKWTDPRVSFTLLTDLPADAEFDLAFCNGVFHHIPVADRPGCVQQIHGALRPGGAFALWENNPWNPGVRYVMSKVPFDRDAITLSPPETRRLLRDGGFTKSTQDFLFIFPRQLSWFRPLETPVCKLPMGGQYLTLGRKPG